MKRIINDCVFDRIRQFYNNVQRKYPHTYFTEDALKDGDKVIGEVFKVSTNQLWHKNDMNIFRGWEGYLVDYSKDIGWYFAYRIENGTIYIEDAENYRNMN